ncbi:DNA topoisomerase IV subunit A [Lactobacillus plantarum JDM1] [Lactiplantibacillus plantarum]|uniref:DNA topoisomerase 4 subunit A n=1 Tax=Lactiplantibacillus plantarum CMPG5300 TaxID=1304889 RepID=A0AAW3FP42_LACPN|nr:DNA topoisomerase IV subunit A [Lactiplantibacillus plantarum]ATI71424.1 DNA topoisomerase IV subunit A [Lactiplantibacillus plantarum]KGH43064.1 topoisomerase IV, subunit A [Lactiplantibacillus plantarum CMPG5300]MCZ2137026.1 DNA topoisomerase IV subunit A [Lactiplantibacillus plantarum]MCZ2273466.1 DNA topoisomerase IV subunit A [Lactiplantibacillus plantarum]NSL96022.1 DNA topoisomerase IV subunit A [Lactiplantibacillus plantarum]
MATEQPKIQELTLEDVMGDRFGRYSKYIIQERALPDIRDGLKPVQRRILYAMNQDGNTFDKAFRKSAKSVGNVMGNFHPHGDSSIYEAMVRLSQDWKLREPLIEMHGNNGSMDGDPAAAMRYTEARLSKIAGEMLQDIDKKTVDMVLNFDDTEYEPTVLPARFPNLLVNGATGISAGYATEIPPHNLSEVIDAILFLMNHPKATLEDLMDFVKGPDFPTGGIIQGLAGIKQAYETGRGRIVVRSRTKIVPLKGNKSQIEVSEIPYEVNKAQLVKKIDEIRILKKIEGIAEVRDESDRQGLSVVIELKRDVNAEGILTYLLKNTDLQITYNFNMVAIYHQRPEHVGLKTILTAYLEHQRDVVTRRTQFNLQKAMDRQHIVQGLIKAMSILDQVIKTIRGSKDKKDAKQNLVSQFDFSDIQAEAIVTMQLYRLTNTDVTQLEKESAELAKAIATYQLILAEPKELDKVLRRELKAVQKAYPTSRLTEIQNEIQELKVKTEVVIPQEDVIVMISHDGYIKRTSLRSYSASEPDDNGLKDEDYPIYLAKNSTLDHLMMFTNMGHLIYRPIYEIADAKWKDTGEHISQTIGLAENERITWVYSFENLKATGKFLVATSDGYIKQTAFADYTPGRTYKTRASQFIKMKSDDATVVTVEYLPAAPTGTLILITQHGYGLRYDLSEVPTIGAKAVGVKSMDLRDDAIVRATIAADDDLIAMITQRGSFKKMKVADLPVTSRARRGVQVLRELKNNPHRVADYVLVASDANGVALDVLTDRGKHHSILNDDHPTSARYSNGSFVVDTDTEGEPVSMQIHPIPLTV